MTLQRLTDAQRDLVENHLGLAKSLALKYAQRHRGRLTFEEALSGAALGMVASASRYKSDQGKYSTSAYKRASGQIVDDMRYNSHWLAGARDKVKEIKINQFRSYGKGAVTETQSEWSVREEDSLVKAKDEIDVVEQNDSVEKLMECLGERERFVIRSIVLDEREYKDVAKELGCGESNVFYLRKTALRKMREYHGKRDRQ